MVLDLQLNRREVLKTSRLLWPLDQDQASAVEQIPEAEALKAITLTPARILGVGDRLGSIQKGKEATFIAVEGDLLDARSQVKRMWIAGKEISLDSRHLRLYEKYRNRPKQN